jgi:transcription elongation factor S-II
MSQNYYIRDNIVNHLVSKIGLTKDYAKDLEIGIFNWTIENSISYQISQNWNDDRFINLYKGKALTIITNLDEKTYLNNQKLLMRLNEGEFLPHEIPYMINSRIFPEKWYKILDDKMRRDNLILSDSTPVANTTQYKCSKCKKKECSYYLAQIRSADEGMSCFVSCLNCGNQWRC